MITPRAVYSWAEARLEPAWPLMVGLSAIVIGVTLLLIWKRNPVALAAWLTYLYMP